MNLNTTLDCLTIERDIINLNCDWNVKAVLQYIKFRLNLKDIEWTFTQTDISHTLRIHKSFISRLFQDFIKSGIFIPAGEQLSRNGFKMKLFKVSPDKFQLKLDGCKVQRLQGDTIAIDNERLQGATTRLQGATYNKEDKKENKKEYSINTVKTDLNDGPVKQKQIGLNKGLAPVAKVSTSSVVDLNYMKEQENEFAAVSLNSTVPSPVLVDNSRSPASGVKVSRSPAVSVHNNSTSRAKVSMSTLLKNPVLRAEYAGALADVQYAPGLTFQQKKIAEGEHAAIVTATFRKKYNAA
jgi:hypothetical protein